MSDFVEKMTLDLDGSAIDGKAAGGLGKTSEGVRSLLGDLVKLAGFVGAEETIRRLVGVGIDANVQFDRMVTTTSTMLGVFGKWTGVTAGSSQALGMAREAAVGLEQAQFKVMGTSEQLFGLYGKLLPVMVTSGAKSTADMVGFATSVAKFADITGQSYEQMAGELSRMVTTGQVLGRSEFGQMIRNLGITPEQIQSWRQSGELIGKVEEILDKASGGVARLKEGWSGVTADIKKGATEIVKEAFEPVFRMITEGATTVRDALFTMTPTGAEMNQSIVKPLGAAFFTAFEVAKVVVGTGWAAIRGISDDAARASGKSFSQLLSESFIDLGSSLIKIWHEVVGLLIPGIELLRHPVDALVAIVENLIDGIIGTASKAAKFLGMDELAKNLADISAEYGEVAAERNKFVQWISGAWDQNDKRTNAALSSLQKYKAELEKPVMSTTGPGGLLPGGPPPLWQQQLDALLNAQNAIAKLNADLGQTSGLSGYSEAVAKVEAHFAGVTVQIDVLEHALAKLGLSGTKEYAQLEALRTKYGSAEAAQLEKAAVDATKAYEDAYAKIGKLANESASEQIEASRLATQRELADLDLKALQNVKSMAELVALDEQTAATRQAINDAASLKQKTLLDESSGNWQGYYNDLVTKAVKAGQGIVEAMQASLKTVADKAYANAVTIEQGVQAFLLKIRSELKTEGQIWSDYLTGIWSALSTGLGTVLLQLETGTGTLKDALKGILNSLLSSFNQMVTEMVKRWLLGKNEMAGGASPLDQLFGGRTSLAGLDAQGNVLPTQGGTIDVTTNRTGGGNVPAASTGQIGAAGLLGAAGAGASLFSSTGGSGFTQGLGMVGGAALGAGLAAIGTALLAGVAVPVLGWVAAAVGVILIAVAAIFKPSTEMSVFGSAIAPQLKATAENVQSGLVDVYAKSLLGGTSTFAEEMNKRIKAYLSSASFFEVHAGSNEDMAADLKQLLTGIVPAEILHTLIGQQTLAGGQNMAGISGVSKYGAVQDTTAPINKMLTDLGFTVGKIQQLAGDIDVLGPDEWMKMLNALVGLVAGAGTLGKQLSKTYAETISDAAATAALSPAGKLADRAAAVTDLLKAVSFYTGTEQITKGQEAIAAAQQFYTDATAAMLQLDAMAKGITQDYLDSVKKIDDALKSPGELFAQSTADLQHDYERMRFAANPEDLAAGWAAAKTDFAAVAGELVNRIKEIRVILADIHTLQAAMVAGPAINATTDPGAWLTKNLADMEKYRVAMTNATPGSPEQIAAATSFAGLLRDRYQMELDLLGRVKSTIESIDQSIGASLTQLQMQGMGSVVGGVWKPDVHAQGQFMLDQVTALQGQLKGAQTPEEVQKIVSQIQALVGQLGGQQQDPAHYAESLKVLQGILTKTQDMADAVLKGMGAAATTDISKLGPQLAAAELVMQGALTAASGDLTDLEWHFKRASEFATQKLNEWGVAIAGQLNTLAPILAGMVTNFTDVNTALTGSGGGGGGKHGPGGFIPIIQDATVAIGDFAGRLRGTSSGGGATAAPASSTTLPISVTVNVTSGAPEDVAQAVATAVYPMVVSVVKKNNVEMARAFRNNPSLLAAR